MNIYKFSLKRNLFQVLFSLTKVVECIFLNTFQFARYATILVFSKKSVMIIDEFLQKHYNLAFTCVLNYTDALEFRSVCRWLLRLTVLILLRP